VSWVVVVPVKRLAMAKSRLADLAGSHRPALALAVARDTVDAALAGTDVVAVVVVTDDAVAGAALRAAGAHVESDEPDDGLNAALLHGVRAAARLHPGAFVAALSADLPALRPAELTAALRLAAEVPVAMVADSAGTGTTLLTARDPGSFVPGFGGDSRRAHLVGGAVEVAADEAPGLHRDVDTEADLVQALGLGVGVHTRAVVAGFAPHLLA
jgi:2-phospho-L-lactate guanylyltransferase